GPEETVRRCLEARAASLTLATADDFRRTTQQVVSASSPASVVTYTEDHAPARTFIEAISNQKGARMRPPNQEGLEKALGQLRYAVSETKVVEGGFERRTHSSFGQFGSLVSQFVP
ncbi:MAG: hypothetical protein M3362_15865, partial [Acidobacteriota bacterium]|nr:hypothetical protein [Acidobacteriota bacterium]